MKQDDKKPATPATVERNLSDALAHCERASERCIRISTKVRAEKVKGA